MVKIYQQPFAHAGTKQVIPDASDPQGFVSNEDGFTTDYELPDTDPNYKPIERAEFNGLMNTVTEAVGELQQFGFAKWQPITWPQGARVVEGGVVYRALTQTAQRPPHADWVDDMGALNTKADKSVTITAGTGLSGGGNLSADRTLSVKYGTTAGTAAQGNDARLSNAREWTATTVSQAEAEAGTGTTRRAWTAQRVRQAITAWWNTIGTAFGKTLLGSANAGSARTNLGLGTAATRNVGTNSGNVMEVGAFGLGKGINNLEVLNHSTKNGFYRMITGSSGAPAGTSGAVIVCGYDGTPTSRGLLLAGSRAFIGDLRLDGNSWIELISAGNILTTTGQSTKYPMSQKAVTDAINSSAIGVGQTWQDVTASRSLNTTYTNTTGRPIMVAITENITSSVWNYIYVDGVIIGSFWNTKAYQEPSMKSFIVPANSNYIVTGDATLKTWTELR